MLNLFKRQTFDIIKNAYAKKDRKPVTTPSTLRLIVPITANRTSFSFPILNGDSNVQHPNQNLLNRADAFTAMQFGVFVGGLERVDADTVQTIAPIGDSSQLGNELIIQDANLLSSIVGLRPYALFNNGLLDITVNNVKYLQNFDILAANKSQSIGLDNLTNEVTFSAVTNGNYGERDGFVDLVPTLQFSGTSKIDITISTPMALLSADLAAPLYLEIIFRGFLSLGASNLNK